MGKQPGSRPGGLRGLANREITLGPLRALVARRAAWCILGLGVLFRAGQYAAGVPLWMDEASLAANIRPATRGDFLGPLSNTQLAPPGFLAVERLDYRVFGPSLWSLRLFPFLAGLGTLGLTLAVAGRWLRPSASLVALGLVAVSDDLIYFSAELKQYSTDVAAALACTLAGLAMRERPVTPAAHLGFAVLGAVVVWFSHPSAFVLAGVGSALIAEATLRRDRRETTVLVLTALVWASSFAGVYLTAMDHLGHGDGMWQFWDFAFPPARPSTAWEAAWVPRRLLFVFVNPLNFETPIGARASIMAPLAFFALGCTTIWRRDRILLAAIMAPVAFTMGASCLRMYPFHGRLVLFLVPSFLLLIAEGACLVGEWSGRRVVWGGVLASLFLFPTVRAAYHLTFDPRSHDEFSRYGDRRPDTLDPERFPFGKAKAAMPARAVVR